MKATLVQAAMLSPALYQQAGFSSLLRSSLEQKQQADALRRCGQSRRASILWAMSALFSGPPRSTSPANAATALLQASLPSS